MKNFTVAHVDGSCLKTTTAETGAGAGAEEDADRQAERDGGRER